MSRQSSSNFRIFCLMFWITGEAILNNEEAGILKLSRLGLKSFKFQIPRRWIFKRAFNDLTLIVCKISSVAKEKRKKKKTKTEKNCRKRELNYDGRKETCQVHYVLQNVARMEGRETRGRKLQRRWFVWAAAPDGFELFPIWGRHQTEPQITRKAQICRGHDLIWPWIKLPRGRLARITSRIYRRLFAARAHLHSLLLSSSALSLPSVSRPFLFHPLSRQPNWKWSLIWRKGISRVANHGAKSFSRSSGIHRRIGGIGLGNLNVFEKQFCWSLEQRDFWMMCFFGVSITVNTN